MADFSLSDVKKRIRALLISCKGGCSPRNLYSDYKEVTGEAIPYEKLGYRSFMALIHDIPDAVSSRLTRDNRTMLYAVPDDKTRHIASMVAKQRGPVCSNEIIRPNSSSRSRAPLQQPSRRIPESFCPQLIALFLSYPNGISLERFPEAYARRYGYYLNYRFEWLGFSDNSVGGRGGAKFTNKKYAGVTMSCVLFF